MDDNLRNLIFQAIDQTISEQDFERLQDAIEQHPETREEYLRAVSLCEALGEIADERKGLVTNIEQDSHTDLPRLSTKRAMDFRWITDWQALAVAAAVLIVVSGAAFWLGRRNMLSDGQQLAKEGQSAGEQIEARIAGHATLRRAVDLKWPDDSARRREGDILPNGTLAFDEGVAEIDFFCGATLIVEGPAELDIESDWSVRIIKGRLRATVPPAARGFVVWAAGSEIVDLGTEFAVEVGAEKARVEVIDGEVELRGGDHDGLHLVTGESQALKGSHEQIALSDGLSTVSDIKRRQQVAESQRFSEWKAHSRQLENNESLIAYYPIAASQTERSVLNASRFGTEFDGLLVGPVDRTTGRFGDLSAGLQFDRPGARVRTRIDGEFSAFTFACWARIDSLEHRYNALFMADSYQTGEPHWQIRDDGSLMFSVMVDDTQTVQHFSEYDKRMVKQAGLHLVYYTEPIWDISKSGQWFHFGAVYDPVGRQVTQYVNGEQVASQKIIDKYHISTLRIGPSEIGNWGQPFRKTPWFAVRNLNGTIDELAIFDAAFKAEQIQSLYQQGKPLGY